MGSAAATRNTHLSNFASGIAPDLRSKLADFIAPQVPTGTSSGQYKNYSGKNAFQVYDTLRSLGGPNKVIEFEATDPFFKCRPRGLAIGVDDHERNQAGVDKAEAQRMLEEAKVKTLVSVTSVSHEAAVFAAVYAAVTAMAGKGVWSNAAIDPVAQIDEAIMEVYTASGMMPNRMVMGLGAWAVFKEHTLVKARQPGAVVQSLSPKLAASMFLNPEIDFRVGMMAKDTAKMGKTKAAANIAGSEVLIFFGADSPTPYDPSFMKTFTPRVGSIDTVTQYRDNPRHSDMYETNWEDDITVVSEDMCRRITLS